VSHTQQGNINALTSYE